MDISPYLSGHKAKIEEEEKKRTSYYQEAIAKAKLIAESLYREYPGIELWLFGSLTTDYFGLDSDIDLAVKGLQEKDYHQACRIAESIAGGISVDLIQIEDATGLLLERIKQEGVKL